MNKQHMIIAIDPGSKGCGVAVLVNGELQKAYYYKAREDFIWVEGTDQLGDLSSVVVFLEKPQVYKKRGIGSSALKGDPNDLVTISVEGGLLAGRFLEQARTSNFGAPPRCSLETFVPATWKKQLPKEVMQERLKKILTETELKRIEKTTAPLMHNVWDAVGIGLWGAKRFHT